MEPGPGACAGGPSRRDVRHPALGRWDRNICQSADGSIYITLINANVLLKVAPDGAVSEFASTPGAANMLGVACGDDQIAIISYGKSFRQPNPSGQGNIFNFTDTDTHILVYDLAGNQVADIAAPGAGLNGFDYAGDGIYYGGDSSSGSIYRIDVANRRPLVPGRRLPSV